VPEIGWTRALGETRELTVTAVGLRLVTVFAVCRNGSLKLGNKVAHHFADIIPNGGVHRQVDQRCYALWKKIQKNTTKRLTITKIKKTTIILSKSSG
jgi:hypothetical protein